MLPVPISLWIARAVVLAAALALIAIPALAHRGAGKKIVRSAKGPGERVLLALVSLGFLCALVWAVTPLFGFADYQFRPFLFVPGMICLLAGLWLLHRSHGDLGADWSITLEIRDGHELVTGGVYRRLRHPMYLALLLYGLGQALVLPNWLAGPAYLAAFALLVACRLGPEERLMTETFGTDYQAYRARTWRLVPGLW
jgi:protein-S-isoprenylcysteine O-methyltransferase Ste14